MIEKKAIEEKEIEKYKTENNELISSLNEKIKQNTEELENEKKKSVELEEQHSKEKETFNEKIKSLEDDGKSGLQKVVGFDKILVILGRILIGVLVSGIIIVALPLLILVVIFNTFLGRSTTINLKKLPLLLWPITATRAALI